MVTILRGDRIGKQGRLAVGCAAAVLNSDQTRILLVRRADNRRWAVPGGFMEPGESVTEACAREVWEETGIIVRVGRLIGVYSNSHLLLAYPDGNRWQIVALLFEAVPVGGELRSGDETTDAAYFAAVEIEHLDMGLFDRQRVADAFAGHEAAFIRDDWTF